MLDRQSILDDLHRDVLAPSSRATQEALWRTWASCHTRWWGLAVPVLPLTVQKLEAVAAQLKFGGYRSAPNYMSAAKRKHCEAGFPWNDMLARCHTDCLASTQRGIGPPHQCAELDLQAIHDLDFASGELAEDSLHASIADEGPVCPRAWCTLAAFHMMRGAESAAASFGDLVLDHTKKQETLRLPVSKTDQGAVGVTRSWGCVCLESEEEQAGFLFFPSRPCPYHAACFLVEELTRMFAGADGVVPPGLPLFPITSGGRSTRQGFVDSVEIYAMKQNLPLTDSMGRSAYGEHVWRVSGARHMARLGISIPVIMLLARWGSAVVMRYVADSPLVDLAGTYKARACATADPKPSRPDKSEEVLRRAVAEMRSMNSAVADLRTLLDQNLQRTEALEAMASFKAVKTISTGRVHAICSGSPTAHPTTWLTKCGWRCGVPAGLIAWLSEEEKSRTPLRCIKCFDSDDL